MPWLNFDNEYGLLWAIDEVISRALLGLEVPPHIPHGKMTEAIAAHWKSDPVFTAQELAAHIAAAIVKDRGRFHWR